MKWFVNMKIAGKLILAFAVVTALTAAVGAIGIINLGEMNDLAETMYEQELLGLDTIQHANNQLLYLGRAEKNVMLASTEDDRRFYVEQHEAFAGRLQETIGTARRYFPTDEGQQLMDEIDREIRGWLDTSREVVRLAQQEELAEARESADLSMTEGRGQAEQLQSSASFFKVNGHDGEISRAGQRRLTAGVSAGNGNGHAYHGAPREHAGFVSSTAEDAEFVEY